MACRYAILRHEGVPQPHFDVMFQSQPDGKLHTWRADIWPIKSAIVLEQLGDHRLAYLTFEGEISGNRGTVRRAERGACRILEQSVMKWLVRFTPEPSGREFVLEFTRAASAHSAPSDSPAVHWRCQPAGPAQ